MAIPSIKRIYQEQASGLGDYNLLSKQELADGYEAAKLAGNQLKKDQYFSAIQLRYWNKIEKWGRDSASLRLELEDRIDWLAEVTMLALDKYAAWLDPKSPLYRDPNGFDKVMNRICFSIRMREYQIANKAVRKYNTETFSLNVTADESRETPLDYIAKAEGPKVDGADVIIGIFLSWNKPIEALILDGIAYQDSFRDKKVVSYLTDENGKRHRGYAAQQSSFDMRKLVKHLTTLDDSFIKSYFCEKYALAKEKGDELLKELKEMPNFKLYNYIRKTIEEIKQTPELLDCLKN